MNLTEVRVPDAVRGGTITTHYVTDDFGSVINVNGPDDGGDAFYRFDGAGRLAESQDNRQLDGGYSIQYFYDRLGRLTEKKSSNGVVSIKHCYDGYNAFCGGTDGATDPGYMTAVDDQVYSWRFDYDTMGRLLTEMSSSSVTVRQYSYAADGRMLWERQPNGLYMKYTHNNDGTVGYVTWSPDSVSAGSVVITGTAWGAKGELRSTVFPVSGSALALRLDWNPFTSGPNYQSGRLESVTLKQVSNGAVLERLTYGYADDGAVKETSRLGTYSEGLGTIRHDSLGRITKDLDTGSSAWGAQAFIYDQAGNRYTRDPNPPGSPLSYTYSSNASNRLTGAESLTYGFDDAGNITSRTSGVSSIGYDPLGRVTSVTTGSGSTTFTRDFRNHRISKTGAGGVGTYRYNDAGEMIQWTGPSSMVICQTFPRKNKTVVPYENYIHVGGRRLAMVKSQGETACGTPSGPIVTVTVLSRYAYFSDKMDIPRAIYRNTNTYSYVQNRPLARVDPMGLMSVDSTGVSDCQNKRCGMGPFPNNWDQGLALAQQAAQKPSCQAWFNGLYKGVNLAALLQDTGGPPIVQLGQGGECFYGTCPPAGMPGNAMAYNPKISCATLSNTPKVIAGTLLHEFGHWGALQSGNTAGENHDLQTGPGYDMERACFGSVQDAPNFCPNCGDL